jgi:hypothetical protein
MAFSVKRAHAGPCLLDFGFAMAAKVGWIWHIPSGMGVPPMKYFAITRARCPCHNLKVCQSIFPRGQEVRAYLPLRPNGKTRMIQRSPVAMGNTPDCTARTSSTEMNARGCAS